MKTKILYLYIIVTMLLSACSGVSAAAIHSAEASSATATVMPTAAAQTPASAAGDTQSKGGGTPPQEAITACTGKTAQDACSFTDQRGTETGVCETVQAQLACSPKHDPASAGGAGGTGNQQDASQPTAIGTPASRGQAGGNGSQAGGSPADANGSGYNIDQAISDKARG